MNRIVILRNADPRGQVMCPVVGRTGIKHAIAYRLEGTKTMECRIPFEYWQENCEDIAQGGRRAGYTFYVFDIVEEDEVKEEVVPVEPPAKDPLSDLPDVEPERAHNENGTFKADDSSTPDINEAYKPDAQPPSSPMEIGWVPGKINEAPKPDAQPPAAQSVPEVVTEQEPLNDGLKSIPDPSTEEETPDGAGTAGEVMEKDVRENELKELSYRGLRSIAMKAKLDIDGLNKSADLIELILAAEYQ